MVSFKNGILRIEKSGTDRVFRLPYEISLYIGILFYFRASMVPTHYVGVAMLIASPVIITAGKLYYKQINKPLLSIWYLLFIAYAEVSSAWAYSPTTSALKYIKFMMVALVVCFGMTQYVDNKNDFERILTIYLCAALSIMLVELIGTPTSRWFSGYFGHYVSRSNANTFGFIVLFASIIAFYKAYILHKRIWYLPTALFLLGCILSSSRKAVLISVFGIMFILLFAVGRKHHILHFFLAIGAAAFIFALLMSNETLYGTIGNRFETLIDFANNEETKHGSLQLREYYIDFAKLLFKRKPLIGQGFANFANLIALETNSEQIYAHNNYWEILADLGIFGFIFYYWIYIYMIVKLLVALYKKKFTYLKLLALAMLISEFILEWGVITMYSPYHQIIIALIFLCATTDAEDKKMFFYTNNKPSTSGGE